MDWDPDGMCTLSRHRVNSRECREAGEVKTLG